MSALNLRARAPNGVHKIDTVKSSDTLAVLLAALAAKSGIPAEKQEILNGFPPKPVIVANKDATLESLGIKNGDQLILKESGSQVGIQKGVEEGPYIPPSEKKGHFVRRIMPGDNSCLFHSLSYVLEGKKSKGLELRKLVSSLILENPKKYTAAFLGMPTATYANWILNPNNWGGAIEISILSEHYQAEVCAFDTQTCREDHYGEDKNYTRRALIIYTGSHYDALALAEHGGANEVTDQVLFNSRDKNVMEKARAYVKEEHEKWKKSKK